MSNSLNEAVNKIFAEREEFIVIGLTGKTGAGCSTTADILSRNFKSNRFKEPNRISYNDNEERKYEVIYDYAQEHWKPFTVIKMRNIITSFILECNFQKFEEYIINLKNVTPKIDNNFFKDKKKFDLLYEKRLKIQEKIKQTPIEALDLQYIQYLIKFYFHDIDILTSKIEDALKDYKVIYEIQSKTNENKEIKGNLFAYLYQEFGKNIRSSGSPYVSHFSGDKTLIIAERANKLIKILRRKNKILIDNKINIFKKYSSSKNNAISIPSKLIVKSGEILRINNCMGVRVVIDCIRNPYEATFFKDRYSAFYLFSLNINNDTRKNRLYKKNLSDEEIGLIDSREKINKDKNSKINNYKKLFYCQNMQGCIDLSDVYLSNELDRGISEDYFNLKEQILRYVVLIMHPGLITPSHIERCMQIAFNAKVNSGCISRQVGAVITDVNFYIKSIGWNNTPEGQIPCNLRYIHKLVKNNPSDTITYSNFELKNKEFREEANKYVYAKLNDRIISYCFKDIYCNMTGNKNQVYTRSLHAEENAFLQISKFGGQGLDGGNLFTTASPCELCAKKAYQIGIKNIYYIDPYPGISQSHILENGNKRPKMIIFNGAIGRAYTQLYTPIIEYKDEISMLMCSNEK